MKKHFYILFIALLAFLSPLSMEAFGTTPTTNSNTEKPLLGCEGVTVVGGSGSIVISGLGAFSDIQVFTPGFAAQVFQRTISTATITIPITAAGDYIVKVWSNPNPAAFCENNFPVTVGGGGGGVSTLTLSGCNNASATAAAGATTAIVNYTTPSATTTCATGGATVTRTSGGASGTAFPVGTSQVCFKATDNCGNTQTCCITITVTGSTGGGGGNVCTDPAGNIVGGAGSITVNGITTSCAVIQVFTSAWTPVYNQQTSGTSVTIPNLTAGSYIVKVTVLGAGCSWPATCDVQTTVTVGGGGGNPCATDVTPPVFAGCPTTINLTTTGVCANASWTAPTATDNCGMPTVAQLLGGANGSCFNVGTTLVKYMATDAKGNTAICAFNVVVTKVVVDPCATDVTAPVFTNCPANIVKTPTAAGSCWTISWTAPTATDNCGVPTITQIAGPTNGSCLAPGTYTVTYRATDAKGNYVHCTFTITVNSYLNCNVVTGNTISKSCVNNVPSLSGAALAGYEYQWLSSTASCPSLTSQAIAGATGQHYTLPSRVSTTTYFVRCARPIGCTTWGAINESNCITVYTTDCAPTVCNAPYTPNGWMYLGVFGTSHYYKWTGSGDITCSDARTKAASIGGRLPVVKTSAQNAFIQSKLSGGSTWIGIRRSGNSWLWDNNAVATYYNWAAYEPNNYGGSETCAQMYPDGTWNDCSAWAYNWCIAEIPCGGLNVYLATNDKFSMDASAELGRARISWINNTGYKNDFFTVEKINATTGNFEKMDVVNNKYSTDVNEFYNVYDNAPEEGDNTYRVKVNYVDGTSKVSDLKTITYKGTADIRLFPNPASDVVGLDLSKYKGQAVTITLYNQFGQQVLTRQIDKVGSETINLDISQNQTGNYLIRVVAKGKKDAIKQLHIAK
jgi:HYR domain/Lectin C-type domain/Secretion system C-terminal sorting domain